MKKRTLATAMTGIIAAFAMAINVGAAAAPGEAAGFTEYPIFEDQEVGFINLSAVYFQPVPMSNGNESIEGFDIHLEADISALENDLGYGVVNADITIVAQKPKLAGYIPEMKRNVARALGVTEDRVNVKATTTERMGFEGEQIGISAQAVALLSK